MENQNALIKPLSDLCGRLQINGIAKWLIESKWCEPVLSVQQQI